MYIDGFTHVLPTMYKTLSLIVEMFKFLYRFNVFGVKARSSMVGNNFIKFGDATNKTPQHTTAYTAARHNSNTQGNLEASTTGYCLLKGITQCVTRKKRDL